MSRRQSRLARNAPARTTPETREAIAARILSTVSLEFGVPSLDSLPDFLVVVEGVSDRTYIRRAAELLTHATGEELLSVPNAARRGPHSDAVVIVPGNRHQPASGGVDRMVELARALAADFFASDVLSGIVFVFDHDHAGRMGQREITKYGYRPGVHSITLDPSEHPAACSRRDVVVEDLLSLPLQRRFFGLGGTSCDVEFREGEMLRIRWIHPSKGTLKTYACANGNLHEFMEMIRLVARIRSTLGFPPTQPLVAQGV